MFSANRGGQSARTMQHLYSRPSCNCQNFIKHNKLKFRSRHLIEIQPCLTNFTTDASEKRTHFVPSILLSNTMSLAPKIDEIAVSLTTNEIDIAFFGETWLKDSIPDDVLTIKGYQLFRRDRKHKSHGAVCSYINDAISCNRLLDLENDSFEVMWVVLRPNRLPRGYSNVIIAVVYHPPGANCESMRDYIQSSLQ